MRRRAQPSRTPTRGVGHASFPRQGPSARFAVSTAAGAVPGTEEARCDRKTCGGDPQELYELRGLREPRGTSNQPGGDTGGPTGVSNTCAEGDGGVGASRPRWAQEVCAEPREESEAAQAARDP